MGGDDDDALPEEASTMPRCPPDMECPADPCAIVIFGATGDLTRRKLLPSLYNLWVNGLLARDFALIGGVRTPMDDAALRDLLSEAIREFAASPVDAARWAEFRARIHCTTRPAPGGRPRPASSCVRTAGDG